MTTHFDGSVKTTVTMLGELHAMLASAFGFGPDSEPPISSRGADDDGPAEAPDDDARL